LNVARNAFLSDTGKLFANVHMLL